MKRTLLRMILPAALLVAMPVGVSAAAEAWLSQLDEIVVTADRGAGALKEVTSNITIIDSETIQNSAANDLAELMAELGFQTRVYPGANSVIGLRGYRSDDHGNDLAGRVLLLLNGRRIGTGNAAVFGLANVERIEIIRGPAATQYGAAAMGGVVNVITKKDTGDDSRPFAASVEAGAGSYDSYKTVLNLTAQLEGFDAAFGYRFYNRDNDYTRGNGDRYKNTRIQANSAMNLDTGYTFLDIHRLGVNINYFDVMASSPGSITSTSYNKIHKSNYNVAFNYAGGTPGEMFTWAANYAFGQDDRIYRAHSLAGFTGRSQYTLDSQTGQAQLSYNHQYLTLTAGFDYTDYDMKDTGAKAEYKNYAGFLLGKLRLFDERVILSAGIRYDDFSLKGKTQQLSTDEDNFSPSVGVAVLPFEWLKLRANYAQGFIMPSASYIFGNSTYYDANLNLKPEKNDTYEAGFDIGWNYLDFGLTYFYSVGKDALNALSYSSPSGTRYRYRNLDKSIREGLEIEFSGDIARALGFSGIEVRPFFNYTYMFTYKGRNTSSDRYLPLTLVPQHNIGYGVRFSYPEYNFTTTLRAAFSCKEYRTSTATTRVQNDSYTVVNWTMRKQLLEFGEYGHLDLKAEVNNLFDKNYAYINNYPSPGRNFYVGLSYSY